MDVGEVSTKGRNNKEHLNCNCRRVWRWYQRATCMHLGVAVSNAYKRRFRDLHRISKKNRLGDWSSTHIEREHPRVFSRAFRNPQKIERDLP